MARKPEYESNGSNIVTNSIKILNKIKDFSRAALIKIPLTISQSHYEFRMLLKEVGKLFRIWEILCKPQKSVLVHGPLIRNQMSFDFVLFCGTLGHLG